MDICGIDNLPFYWRLEFAEKKFDKPVEDVYPFYFSYDEKVGVLIQRRTPEVIEALTTIYSLNYNIGYLQEGNKIAIPYGVDFYNYLSGILNNKKNASILEVGCGGCLLLSQLMADGYRVKGIDSSSFAVQEGRRFGVDVCSDFYPTDSLVETFDLIYHVDVLEHIDDYISFLKAHKNNLNDGGYVVINVPDASESIEKGDISMAMHQHLNYFTEHSIRQCLEYVGYKVVAVDKAGYGGSLYAVAQYIESDESTILPSRSDTFKNFEVKVKENINCFKKAVSQIQMPSNSIGFYVPLRALPYISLLNNIEQFRFFDDTENWYGREFDGVNITIENFEDLQANPVSHLFIMSLTFGDVIKEKVKGVFGEQVQIILLNEILNGDIDVK